MRRKRRSRLRRKRFPTFPGKESEVALQKAASRNLSLTGVPVEKTPLLAASSHLTELVGRVSGLLTTVDICPQDATGQPSQMHPCPLIQRLALDPLA